LTPRVNPIKIGLNLQFPIGKNVLLWSGQAYKYKESVNLFQNFFMGMVLGSILYTPLER
jgi:hypothetical protein